MLFVISFVEYLQFCKRAKYWSTCCYACSSWSITIYTLVFCFVLFYCLQYCWEKNCFVFLKLSCVRIKVYKWFHFNFRESMSKVEEKKRWHHIMTIIIDVDLQCYLNVNTISCPFLASLLKITHNFPSEYDLEYSVAKVISRTFLCF